MSTTGSWMNCCSLHGHSGRRRSHGRVWISPNWPVVLANSDQIDKLGVAPPPSIPWRASFVGSLGRCFRFLSQPCGASARDPRSPPSTRRSPALRQATQIDPGGSLAVGLAVRRLERLAVQRLYRQGRDRHRLAPERLSFVLGLEGPPR